jgi:hypothetical protein
MFQTNTGMNLLQKLYQKTVAIKTTMVYNKSKERNELYQHDGSIESVNRKFVTRNEIYNYYHHYFWNMAPDWIRTHREYFKKESRGFGEDAFHAMWYNIFKEFKPKRALEIGIYRGQVISLWGLLSEKLDVGTDISGISPFSPAGDDVSVYLRNIDYYEDVKKNCSVFNKRLPSLARGFSTDKEMIDIIRSQSWDLIYIDGNHDYEVVRQDFEVCSQSLNKNGLLVLDDSALYTDYTPLPYSTAGHPGPSAVAKEIDKNKFVELISVGHNRVFQKR